MLQRLSSRCFCFAFTIALLFHLGLFYLFFPLVDAIAVEKSSFDVDLVRFEKNEKKNKIKSQNENKLRQKSLKIKKIKNKKRLETKEKINEYEMTLSMRQKEKDQKLDLSIRSDFFPMPAKSQKSEKNTLQKRVQNWSDDIVAKLRVKQGNVHRDYFRFEDKLNRYFKAKANFGKRFNTLKLWTNNYLAQAKRSTKIPIYEFSAKRSTRGSITRNFSSKSDLNEVSNEHGMIFQREICFVFKAGEKPQRISKKEFKEKAIQRWLDKAIIKAMKKEENAAKDMPKTKACYLVQLIFGRHRPSPLDFKFSFSRYVIKSIKLNKVFELK